MRYASLGGVRVSVVGLGFWQAASRLWGTGRGSLESVRAVVEKALALGINFFDTAEIYGMGRSEELLGEAIRSLNAVEEAVVATKVAGYRTTRDSIVRAAEASRRRLGFTPYLLQYHWPPPVYVPLCRVIRGLEDAVDRGYANAIGVSNFPAGLLARALECTRRHEIVSNQVQYSLAYRKPENGLKEFMEERGVRLVAWSPLAKGALAGAPAKVTARRSDPVYWRALRDERLQETLERIAGRHGVSKAVIALAWLVARNAIPIPGTTRPERVEEYAKAATMVLSESEVAELDSVSEKYRGRDDYDSLQTMRLIPAPLQALAIKLTGGI